MLIRDVVLFVWFSLLIVWPFYLNVVYSIKVMYLPRMFKYSFFWQSYNNLSLILNFFLFYTLVTFFLVSDCTCRSSVFFYVLKVYLLFKKLEYVLSLRLLRCFTMVKKMDSLTVSGFTNYCVDSTFLLPLCSWEYLTTNILLRLIPEISFKTFIDNF